MSLPAWTMPQLAKALGAPYRTLQTWVERGLVNPSVHRSKGSGRANLFDAHDAFVLCVLHELRQAGVKFSLLEEAAAELDAARGMTDEPVYLLLNGRVDVVSDPVVVTKTINRGGLTLTYYTAPALKQVSELPPA